MPAATEPDGLLRELAPLVLGACVGRPVPVAGRDRRGARRSGADPALAGHHRLHAVRAHLLELAGDLETARGQYLLAAQRTLSVPEQRYLESRAAGLVGGSGGADVTRIR